MYKDIIWTWEERQSFFLFSRVVTWKNKNNKGNTYKQKYMYLQNQKHLFNKKKVLQKRNNNLGSDNYNAEYMCLLLEYRRSDEWKLFCHDR